MADTVNPDAEMIEVVLMRHGEAQALAGKDAARPLTQWGRVRLRRLSQKCSICRFCRSQLKWCRLVILIIWPPGF